MHIPDNTLLNIHDAAKAKYMSRQTLYDRIAAKKVAIIHTGTKKKEKVMVIMNTEYQHLKDNAILTTAEAARIKDVAWMTMSEWITRGKMNTTNCGKTRYVINDETFQALTPKSMKDRQDKENIMEEHKILRKEVAQLKRQVEKLRSQAKT